MVLIIVYLTALINIILGILSYKKNPRSATNKLLTFLAFIFAFWTIANFYSLNSSSETTTLFWIRMVMLITSPLGLVIYLFIKAFPGKILYINKYIFYLLASITLILIGISFTPFMFSGVSITDSVKPTPGPGVALFGMMLLISFGLGSIELIRKYRRAIGIERLQLRYLIFGIVVTFGLQIATNYIAVFVFNSSTFVLLGPIFSLIFVGFIFYAIVRHRLLQVRIILARSVAYTLLITILATIYSAGLSLLTTYVLTDIAGGQLGIASGILAIIIVFTFDPLKSTILELTDKIFFKGGYRSEEMMLEMTTLLASTINLKHLTSNILNKLLETLRIEQGVFVIFRKHNRYSMVYEGYRQKPQVKKEQLKHLLPQKKLIIANEESDKKLKILMSKMGINIAIPLREHDQTEGLILLGSKKSGEIYTEQDIKFLEIIGPIISIAVQNAKGYEEIKTFNRTLTDKITDATREIQLSHRKLQTIDKQKDQFIGMASHELKTPITSIKAFTQVLIQRALKEQNAYYAHILKNINTQVDRITNLINDLLNVSNIEAGRLILKKKTIDFDKFISEVATNLQYTTDKHKIIKKGTVNKNVEIDVERIEQVLSNLLTNAIKYSPRTDKITIAVAEKPNSVRVTVTDNGPGIPKEEQVKIFERFYRTQLQERSTVSGFGLGLYISSEIIRKHKGKLWVKSDVGKGSTFGFDLPV